MPRCKPRDPPATPVSPHAPSRVGSLPLPSQGIRQTLHAVLTLLAQVPEEAVVQNSHPCNPPASLSSTLDNMKVVIERMAGLHNKFPRFMKYVCLSSC